MTEQKNYKIEDRDATLANIFASGRVVVKDVTIDLDANGILQTCYCITEDAPPLEPDFQALLAQADMDILNLTEQLILTQEGL